MVLRLKDNNLEDLVDQVAKVAHHKINANNYPAHQINNHKEDSSMNLE